MFVLFVYRNTCTKCKKNHREGGFWFSTLLIKSTQMRVSVCTLWKYYLTFDVMLLDKDIISNFLENSESFMIFTVWKNGQTNAFDLGNLESSPEILLVHKVCKICRGNTISPIHILIHHMYIRLKFPKFFKTFPKHLKFYLLLYLQVLLYM